MHGETKAKGGARKSPASPVSLRWKRSWTLLVLSLHQRLPLLLFLLLLLLFTWCGMLRLERSRKRERSSSQNPRVQSTSTQHLGKTKHETYMTHTESSVFYNQRSAQRSRRSIARR